MDYSAKPWASLGEFPTGEATQGELQGEYDSNSFKNGLDHTRNKAIGDIRLRPRVRNLASPPSEWRRIIRRVADAKPVSVYLAYYYVKTSRHPQNRKYIT